MNILAVDTSTDNISLALQVQGKLFAINKLVKNEQSNFIIPEIKKLLDEVCISVDKIDIIAYNQGPGSFTGLRIGLSVVLGMAYARNIKIVPVPSFYIYMAEALNKLNNNNIIVGLDARLTQIYLAGISKNNYEYCINPVVISPEEITINLSEYICIGNGFKNYYDKLPAKIQSNIYLDGFMYPDASYLIELVNNGICDVVDINKLNLLYLRDKVALNKEEQKQIKLQ